MKLAILIQCHKNPEQINLLLEQLEHPNVDVFIHVDKKSKITDEILCRTNVFILPDDLRVDVRWGTFSQVLAAINLLSYAREHYKYEYYWQISGQDYLIQPISEILNFLSLNIGCNFINLCKSKYNGLGKSNSFDKRTELYFPRWIMKRNLLTRILRRIYVIVTGGRTKTFSIFKRKNIEEIKPCFGSCWWCLYVDFVDYAIEYIKNNSKKVDFFNNVSCPDEAFIQTIFMNSPYSDSQKEYLHYIDWSTESSSPKNLVAVDFDAIVCSKKFMTRKIDGDFVLIDMLNNHIKNMERT